VTDFNIIIGAILESNVGQKLQAELDKYKNLSINVSDIKLNGKALQDVQTMLKNSNVKLNLQADLDRARLESQGRQAGETIGKQIQSGMNGIIQKGKFEKIFNPGKINTAAKEAENYFKTISKSVSVTEELGKNNNLTSFVVQCKNAEGVVEKLRYNLQVLKDDQGKAIGNYFQYAGGSINDNGVTKQLDTISSKANDLSIKLEKLKMSYSDLNAAKPIKDVNNLSALNSQYMKVQSAIEAVRNSDSSTFTAMTSNVNTEIATLDRLITQFRNAEYAATSLRTKHISTVKIDEGHNLDIFVEKIKQSGLYTTDFEAKISALRADLNKAFDSDALTAYLNRLSNVESEFKAISAAAKTTENATLLRSNIETEKTKLINYRNELESTGKLTTEFRQKFDTLQSSLSSVTTPTGLKVWQSEFQTLKNNIIGVEQAKRDRI